LFSFQLPYPNQLTFQQKMNYPVANVDVLVSDLGVQLSGARLQSLGLQNFQGQEFQNFSATRLATGDTLDLSVSGRAGTGATAPNGVLNNSSGTLAIGLGALVLVAGGIGVWFVRRGRPVAAAAGAARDKDKLLEAMAELDDEYAAGKLPEAEYKNERAALKQMLLKVWQ